MLNFVFILLKIYSQEKEDTQSQTYILTFELRQGPLF